MPGTPDDETDVLLDHKYDDELPASIMIVKAICSLENSDPVETSADLGFTLYDHVDPDALDTIVESGDQTLLIEFEFDTYSIRLKSSERIVVTQ